MDQYTFELRVTRIPKQITPDMSLMKRIYARTFNSAQKNTFLGIVKLLADGFKIDRSKLSDKDYSDTVQSIQVDGTKEFCEKCRTDMQGIEEDKLQEFTDAQANTGFFSRIGKSMSKIKEDIKGKGWNGFVNNLASGGIVITLDVFERKE